MPYHRERKRTPKPDSNPGQLYKGNNFVAKSVSSAYSSKINITADGQRVVKGVNTVKERHLRAEPELPTLEERAAISNNKNLYKLSKQLAEASEDDKASKIYFDNKPQINRRQDKCNFNQLCADVEDSDRTQDSDETKKKLLRKRKSRGSSQEESLTHENVGDYIKEQVRLMTLKRLAEEDECYCLSPKIKEDLIITRTPASSPRSRMPAVAVVPRTTPTVKHFVDRGSDPISEFESSIQSINLQPTDYANNEPEVSLIDQVLYKIDDYYYIYTLILHLAIFGYLIYILFIDISEHLNEEQRFLAKMQTSPLAVKYFYYLMQWLNVRIF